MLFNTKAQTLSLLKLKRAIIPKIFYFKVVEFKKNPEKYLQSIKKKFSKKVAVRSSSANEDQENNSLAGYFDSFLNINSNKIDELKSSIKKVIKSYQRKSDKKDEILIQEMVSDVKFSGVITTNDKVTGAPYIQINFSTGNKTNTVTSGGRG